MTFLSASRYRNLLCKYNFRVVYFDICRSAVQDQCGVLDSAGWDCTAISTLSELLAIEDWKAYDLVLIDNKSNAYMMASRDKIDVAREVRSLGYELAVVSITDIHGQRPSSTFFSDCIHKPLIEAESIRRLEKITCFYIYGRLISMHQ